MLIFSLQIIMRSATSTFSNNIFNSLILLIDNLFRQKVCRFQFLVDILDYIIWFDCKFYICYQKFVLDFYIKSVNDLTDKYIESQRLSFSRPSTLFIWCINSFFAMKHLLMKIDRLWKDTWVIHFLLITCDSLKICKTFLPTFKAVTIIIKLFTRGF